MINRLFHRPMLHSPTLGAERRVGWLELFYDLIYVAAIIQLGNALSAHPTWLGMLEFFALFLPIWYTWTGFTFFSNRFVVDDLAHRALVFLQMFGIGVMAVTLGRVFDGETGVFALSYGFVRLAVVLWYARAWWQEPKARELGRRFALGFAAGSVLWLGSALIPAPWVYPVWGAAMILDLTVALSRASRDLGARYPVDVLHFTERYGLLTIIVLGESFVKVLSAVSDEGGRGSMVWMAGLGLVITCSVWWIYFDDVAGSRIREGRLTTYTWIYTHLPLTASITALGVAQKKLVLADPGELVPAKYRWLLCVALGMVFFSVGLIDRVTERRHAELSDDARVKMRFASAGLILLLAPAGAGMPAWAFLGFVALACVVQVAWDLTMAPEAAPETHHEHLVDRGAGADRRPPPLAPLPRSRRLALDAVRKGVPNEFRRDLYFHFMEGSWGRIFGYAAAFFVLGNVVFGALYMLDPNGVATLDGTSFIDAFSFSVQTVATIGYGVMHPTSTYADVLVTIEAFLGMILIALVTGLVFAKASRPQSSVLFSDPVCITTRDGKRTLTFRCGNARGNEVVEATIRVAALRQIVSPEGHAMRKLYDLQLERSLTPMFAMSWSVFHVLDEDSPLCGLSENTCQDDLVALIITLTGHDSTYGSTTYARHLYFAEDFRWNQRFVDVISTLPNGRLVIDYEKFHDTVPDPGDARLHEGAAG